MSTGLLAATSSPSPLWYFTRATGIVALVLLTASVVLGILSLRRTSTMVWPRFITAGLHRSVSLLVVLVLVGHVVTAELDTFAPIGWAAVILPFASAYRPVWLGLGTVALDMLVALAVTSLLRKHLGYRTWRAIHWLAYLCWPIAVLHGVGTGTDTRLSWVLGITAVCVAAVTSSGIWRLAEGWPSGASTRVAVASLGAVVLAAGIAWTINGPLQTGWARRAGTPHTLLSAPASKSAASDREVTA